MLFHSFNAIEFLELRRLKLTIELERCLCGTDQHTVDHLLCG